MKLELDKIELRLDEIKNITDNMNGTATVLKEINKYLD